MKKKISSFINLKTKDRHKLKQKKIKTKSILKVILSIMEDKGR